MSKAATRPLVGPFPLDSNASFGHEVEWKVSLGEDIFVSGAWESLRHRLVQTDVGFCAMLHQDEGIGQLRVALGYVLRRVIAKTAVTRTAFGGHARQDGLAAIDIVVDHHLDLAGMQAMQSAGILGKSSLP